MCMRRVIAPPGGADPAPPIGRSAAVAEPGSQRASPGAKWMTMHRMLRVLVIAFASVVLTAVQARAQSGPSADFAFGYVYMHDNDLDTGFPAGWMVSAAGHVTSWFSLVGEVGGSYKTVSGPPDVSLSLHTFSFGPRFGVTQRAPIAPFIQ